MANMLTFYLSRALDNTFYSANGSPIGKIKDFLVDFDIAKPKIIALKTIINKKPKYYDISNFEMSKVKGKYNFVCKDEKEYFPPENSNYLDLKEVFLDKQIVDINGRKLVRVNDIRIASVSSGVFAVAVDVGFEGLLRRIGIAKPINFLLKPFKVSIPAKFILWDDVEAVDFSNLNVKLSKTTSKIKTLHPSDLADIIEDLGKSARDSLFNSLDFEQAADVLEELEPKAQAHIIESMSIEKAADIIEKMPADEAADLLEELEDERAEALLNEMDRETSNEVRELLEYDEETVGSIMNSEFLVFMPENTVADVVRALKTEKPESQNMYSVFVIDYKERLIATITLRDLILAEPENKLKDIMSEKSIYVFDTDRIDTLAEIISKYNLLTVPVVNKDKKLEGMVIIDDIVEDLLGERKTA